MPDAKIQKGQGLSHNGLEAERQEAVRGRHMAWRSKSGDIPLCRIVSYSTTAQETEVKQSGRISMRLKEAREDSGKLSRERKSLIVAIRLGG